MKKIFLMALIVGLMLGCATTKDSAKEKDFTKWTDEQLMDRFIQLEPGVQYISGGIWGLGYSAAKTKERDAIRKELESRGYVYRPEKREAAIPYGHPEWEKKQD